MKRLLPILSILILAFSALVPMVAAQDVVSAGCTDIVGTITEFSGEFSAGEQVTLTGTGDFTVTVNSDTPVDVVAPDTFVYGINSGEVYTFSVAGATVTADCLSEVEVPDFSPGTICHYPPGNPANAHTITVGLPAVQTHIDRHGDSEGPCSEEVDTILENPDTNMEMAVYPLDGIIEIFSDCGEDNICDETTTIIFVSLIDFESIMDEDGNFIELGDDEEMPFEVVEDNESIDVILYYLHPDPEDSTVGVFQINIYDENDVLVDDNILVFITFDGEDVTIVRWTDHGVWDLDDDDS